MASKFFFSKIIFFSFFFPFYAEAVYVPCFFGSFSSPLKNACKSFVVIVAREVDNGILKEKKSKRFESINKELFT